MTTNASFLQYLNSNLRVTVKGLLAKGVLANKVAIHITAAIYITAILNYNPAEIRDPIQTHVFIQLLLLAKLIQQKNILKFFNHLCH